MQIYKGEYLPASPRRAVITTFPAMFRMVLSRSRSPAANKISFWSKRGGTPGVCLPLSELPEDEPSVMSLLSSSDSDSVPYCSTCDLSSCNHTCFISRAKIAAPAFQNKTLRSDHSSSPNCIHEHCLKTKYWLLSNVTCKYIAAWAV